MVSRSSFGKSWLSPLVVGDGDMLVERARLVMEKKSKISVDQCVLAHVLNEVTLTYHVIAVSRLPKYEPLLQSLLPLYAAKQADGSTSLP